MFLNVSVEILQLGVCVCLSTLIGCGCLLWRSLTCLLLRKKIKKRIDGARHVRYQLINEPHDSWLFFSPLSKCERMCHSTYTFNYSLICKKKYSKWSHMRIKGNAGNPFLADDDSSCDRLLTMNYIICRRHHVHWHANETQGIVWNLGRSLCHYLLN